MYSTCFSFLSLCSLLLSEFSIFSGFTVSVFVEEASFYYNFVNNTRNSELVIFNYSLYKKSNYIQRLKTDFPELRQSTGYYSTQ